jgi:hypothetical protein
MAHNPCCCNDSIGFDLGSNSAIMSCAAGMSAIINLKDDVSQLSRCKIVFAGASVDGFCPSSAVNFAGGDWDAVKTYIQGGGRLVLVTEFEGCAADSTTINAFLLALGSSIAWVGGAYSCGCGSSPGNRSCLPGAARIASNVDFGMACTAELSGGTSVWLSPDESKRMWAVQKLGDGFLFVTGDASHWVGCSYNICAFTTRLWEYADGEII